MIPCISCDTPFHAGEPVEFCPVCRADLWEPGQKITTEEEQVLRCLERGTYEDRRVARNIRELLAV